MVFSVFALSLKEIEETTKVRNKIRRRRQKSVYKAGCIHNNNFQLFVPLHSFRYLRCYSIRERVNSYRVRPKISRQFLHFKRTIRKVSFNRKNDLQVKLELQTTIRGICYIAVRRPVEANTESSRFVNCT